MTTPAPRIAKIERTTKESDISVELNLDGTGIVDISTGVPFYDHMLTALGTHARLGLAVAFGFGLADLPRSLMA